MLVPALLAGLFEICLFLLFLLEYGGFDLWFGVGLTLFA